MLDVSSDTTTIEAFNVLMDDILREAEDGRRIVNDGSCLGCPRSVPRYSPSEIGGIREAVKDAKEVFASKLSLLEKDAEGPARKDALIKAVTEELKGFQNRGDPYDENSNAYNAALAKIIGEIPGSVKDMKI